MIDATLRLKLGEADFTQGRSTYRDHLEDTREPTAKIYVPRLLDAMRFAIDPQANHFYFGP